MLVKSIVKVKAERPRSSDPSVTVGSVKSNTSSQDSNVQSTGNSNSPPEEILTADTTKTPGGLLGLAYESEEDSDEEPVSILAVKRPRNQRDE